MIIQYTPREDDLLTHQLFLTSQSKQVIKRRAKGKFFILLIYMAMGIYIWNRNGVPTAAIFFLLCLPLYFLYAAMERRQYVKHFRRSIQTHYKDQLERTTSIHFEDEKINLSDGVNENTIPVSQIEIIHETGTLYSITMKTGESFFIPKNDPAVPADLGLFLSNLAESLQIPYQQMSTWKWK